MRKFASTAMNKRAQMRTGPRIWSVFAYVRVARSFVANGVCTKMTGVLATYHGNAMLIYSVTVHLVTKY